MAKDRDDYFEAVRSEWEEKLWKQLPEQASKEDRADLRADLYEKAQKDADLRAGLESMATKYGWRMDTDTLMRISSEQAVAWSEDIMTKQYLLTEKKKQALASGKKATDADVKTWQEEIEEMSVVELQGRAKLSLKKKQEKKQEKKPPGSPPPADTPTDGAAPAADDTEPPPPAPAPTPTEGATEADAETAEEAEAVEEQTAQEMFREKLDEGVKDLKKQGRKVRQKKANEPEEPEGPRETFKSQRPGRGIMGIFASEFGTVDEETGEKKMNEDRATRVVDRGIQDLGGVGLMGYSNDLGGVGALNPDKDAMSLGGVGALDTAEERRLKTLEEKVADIDKATKGLREN